MKPRIAIFGAGAVGCTVGSFLHEATFPVTFISRGKHLEAVQQSGLVVTYKNESRTIKANFVDETAKIPTPDILFITLKSYDLPAAAERIRNFIEPNTLIIPIMNGLPWWHFFGLEGPLKNQPIAALDPKQTLEKYLPASQLLGGVVYVDATLQSPGHVLHRAVPRLKVGELSSGITPRLKHLDEMLESAGFKDPITSDIRAEIWLKLCWNVCFNPISVLTGAPSGPIADTPGTRDICTQMMQELHQLAAKLNIHFLLNIEERLMIGTKGGAHKPSMLQDFERGKPIEIDGIIGAVAEIATQLNIPAPTLQTIYALLAQKIQTR